MEGFIIEDCICLVSTQKAILVQSPNLDDDIWIPKSQIHELSEVYGKDHDGQLIITEWFAKQIGLY